VLAKPPCPALRLCSRRELTDDVQARGTPLNLATIDLNLLVVFDALMIERNVTRAGQRIGLSQPAMSAALGRLRHIVGDELLVRRTGGMDPTPRALELEQPVRRALLQIQAALGSQVFEPHAAMRTFRIATNDFAASMLLPALCARLRAQAPGIDVRVLAADEQRSRMLLERAECDLAIAPFESFDPRFLRQEIMPHAGFLCVMRKDHPLAGTPLTLDRFAATPQVLVSQIGDTIGFVDSILAEHGLKRRVAVTVPHFLVAPLVVATTDLIATLPIRLARAFAAMADLIAVEPPFAQRHFPLAMLWTERTAGDPGHRWLRATLVEVAAER
jgi:DNA-binding transcriptional LysR family regulator